MARTNKVGLILGKRSTGKTYYLRPLIEQYKLKHPSQKVLIISMINQPGYVHIPTISISELKRWIKPNTYKLYGSNTDEILEAIESCYENGLVLMEDATSFIPKIISKETRRMIVDTKQKNVDLLMTFHGFMSVPPELFRMCDTITMFRTDHPKSRKDDIGAYYDEVLIAYEKILKSKNPYEKITIKVS